MKVAFAGPSVHGASLQVGGYDLRGPARQGDLFAAVEQGATDIGLVDGWFGSSASVWHKEIMFALARGVRVYGASSMGAIRAAECACYGMVPVGVIAFDYLNGNLDDDAAVALTFGPPELNYVPLVEPLVDVWPTVRALLAAGRVTREEAAVLKTAAEGIFYQDRTVDEILTAFPLERRRQLAFDYEVYRVPQKQVDALELLNRLSRTESQPAETASWELNRSPFWPAATRAR